ncbi:MAG: YceI family protein [Candidatus Wenzhouxiangella sp. M2_3B_020]
MENLIRISGLVLALGSLPAAADEACFSGGGDSGFLEFSGAVEGTGFTGRFADFSVEYCFPGSEPAAGGIRVEVVLESADTDNRDRDQTLMGPEFFAVDEYPRARWRSTRVERADDGYRGRGELTLKGITRDQPIRFTLEPDGADYRARGEFTLAGSADVDRQRFDVGTGDFADPEFVRNRVDVRFDVALERGSD